MNLKRCASSLSGLRAIFLLLSTYKRLKPFQPRSETLFLCPLCWVRECLCSSTALCLSPTCLDLNYFPAQKRRQRLMLTTVSPCHPGLPAIWQLLNYVVIFPLENRYWLIRLAGLSSAQCFCVMRGGWARGEKSIIPLPTNLTVNCTSCAC